MWNKFLAWFYVLPKGLIEHFQTKYSNPNSAMSLLFVVKISTNTKEERLNYLYFNISPCLHSPVDPWPAQIVALQSWYWYYGTRHQSSCEHSNRQKNLCSPYTCSQHRYMNHTNVCAVLRVQATLQPDLQREDELLEQHPKVGQLIIKAAFQLRVFYTYVHARKSLNPIQYYIWSEQMFWWREFSIPYDLASFSDFIC